MISNTQIELLAEIQRLAMACQLQTGHSVEQSTRFYQTGYVHSTVSIRESEYALSAIYQSHASISPEGIDSVADIPRQMLRDTDRSLMQQRDELASWIADHRREVAA